MVFYMNAHLRDLRAFLVLVEELHFGRTALRLGLAQPNLSALIRRLEERIGAPLFSRRPRLELTAAGEIMARGAREMFEQLEITIERTRLAAAGKIGVVRAGFASTAMLSSLPDVFRIFRKQNPGIELRLREMASTAQWDALRLGDIDVAITREAGEDPAVHKRLIISEPFCIAIPAGHRLAAGEEPASLADLAAEDFVMFRRALGAPLHDAVMKLCATAGFSPRIVQEADELHSVFGLIRAEFGVTLAPSGLSNVGWPGVVFRRLAASPIRANLFCCWRPAVVSPVARQFVESLPAPVATAIAEKVEERAAGPAPS